MKICTDCKESRELTEFSKDKSRKDGFYPQCKICCRMKKTAYDAANKDKNAAYREKNKEEKIAYDIDYRLKNREKLHIYEIGRKELKSEYNSLYAKANPGKMNARTAKRNAIKLQATPKWLTDSQLLEIEAIYIEAARLTKETGIPHHVDHVIPLQNKDVCGLHVPWNLQILTAAENIAKSNKLTP